MGEVEEEIVQVPVMGAGRMKVMDAVAERPLRVPVTVIVWVTPAVKPEGETMSTLVVED